MVSGLGLIFGTPAQNGAPARAVGARLIGTPAAGAGEIFEGPALTRLAATGARQSGIFPGRRRFALRTNAAQRGGVGILLAAARLVVGCAHTTHFSNRSL